MIHRTAPRPTSRKRPMGALTAAPEYYSLLRSLAGQPDSPVIRSLGIISSRSGEGVSTVALQCAAAAQQIFVEPILLVEANAGRPSLHRTLRLKRAPGFGDLLVDADHREQCIQQYSEQLFVTTAGSVAARSLTRCSAQAIARTVETLHEGHRLTIWDLPAADGSQLSLELAAQLDGVLLVVESERALSDVAQKATEQLRAAGAKVLGAVLNKHREHMPRWLAARL